MKAIRLTLLAAAAAASLVSAPALAADLYVIANGAMTLSADDVRDVFLGDKQIANGTKLLPLDNAAEQRDFLDKVLKLDAAKYNAIWIKKGFRDGLNAPPVKASDADVIATVRANPGAIGYVANPPKDLKVLGKY